MSGAVTAAVVGTVVSVAGSLYQGNKQAKAADKANRQAQENARRQEKAADEATNRANQKRADPSAALSNAMQAGKSGASGTMLTGAQGIDPNALTLGKNTLLGA